MYKILGICLLTKKSKIIEGQMFSNQNEMASYLTQ